MTPEVNHVFVTGHLFNTWVMIAMSSSRELSPEQLTRLNLVSALSPEFSDALTTSPIRRMIFGGQNVTGWSERSA